MPGSAQAHTAVCQDLARSHAAYVAGATGAQCRWHGLSGLWRQSETETAPLRYVAELIAIDTDPERDVGG